MAALSRVVWLIEIKLILESYNPRLRKTGFRLFPVRSPLLRESLLISSPQLLRCFSSPGIRHIPMNSVYSTPPLREVGFPIRKSPGQSLFSNSPKLFAANHVLHRLLPPRHPPSALYSLTINRAGQHMAFATIDLYILQARRSQLGKIFSYQRSTDSKNHSPTCSGRAHLRGCLCSSCTSLERRETRLSSESAWDLVELDGIEPTTSGLQSPRSPS